MLQGYDICSIGDGTTLFVADKDVSRSYRGGIIFYLSDTNFRVKPDSPEPEVSKNEGRVEC